LATEFAVMLSAAFTQGLGHACPPASIVGFFHGAFQPRIPLGKFPIVARFTSQETAVDTPITEIVVNSLITRPADDTQVKAGALVTIGGIACVNAGPKLRQRAGVKMHHSCRRIGLSG
jgi:hypothetical protein